MPTKRPTGYYDVKQSAGEKGKRGKGVKKSTTENVAKQTKSLKKGEKLDCRKRSNKTLKECVERALKKAREKKARESATGRYSKSRKGVKQPKNRKKPKKHTTKGGVVRGGLPIATQGFRDDRVAGRGQPQQQIQASQPQGINMGFGSPFGVGAVFNQLQSAQVREREAQAKAQTEVKRIFDEKQALSQRIQAQNTQLDILRSRFDTGEFRPPPRDSGRQPTGMVSKGGAKSVGFASESEFSADPDARIQDWVSLGGLGDATYDTEFHNNIQTKKRALQIKALDKEREEGVRWEGSPVDSPPPQPVSSPMGAVGASAIGGGFSGGFGALSLRPYTTEAEKNPNKNLLDTIFAGGIEYGDGTEFNDDPTTPENFAQTGVRAGIENRLLLSIPREDYYGEKHLRDAHPYGESEDTYNDATKKIEYKWVEPYINIEGENIDDYDEKDWDWKVVPENAPKYNTPHEFSYDKLGDWGEYDLDFNIQREVGGTPNLTINKDGVESQFDLLEKDYGVPYQEDQKIRDLFPPLPITFSQRQLRDRETGTQRRVRHIRQSPIRTPTQTIGDDAILNRGGTPRRELSEGGEDPLFDFGEEPTDTREGGRLPSPQILDKVVPISNEDVRELSESQEGETELNKKQKGDLNQLVKRFRNTGARGGGTSEVDFSYGGATIETQKQAYEDMDKVYREEGSTGFYEDFEKIEGHKNMLAPLVRAIGQPIDFNMPKGITADNYFGMKLDGTGKTHKRIKKNKKGLVIGQGEYLEDEDEWDAPPARWEQVVFDKEEKIVRLHEYTDHTEFDMKYGNPYKPTQDVDTGVIKDRGYSGVLQPADQFGRFVSNFDDKRVVWSPFTQSWEDRPEGLSGIFTRPQQAYNSSLEQDAEGMPQPFRNTMPKDKDNKGISQYSIADAIGNQDMTQLVVGRGRQREGEQGRVEEVPIDVILGEVEESGDWTSESGSGSSSGSGD